MRVIAGRALRAVSDVLSRAALAKRHRGYHNRLLMGPTWRADVWTELESEPELSASEAARRVGCAFATAWIVKRDFDILHEAVTRELRS